MQSLKRIKVNAKRSMMKKVIKCKMKTGCFLFILQPSVIVQWEQSYPSIPLFWVTCPSNLPTRQIYELTITNICKLTKQHGALYIVKFYTVGLLINFSTQFKIQEAILLYMEIHTFPFASGSNMALHGGACNKQVVPSNNRVFGQRQPPFNPLHQASFLSSAIY